MRTYLLVVVTCVAMLMVGCENKSQQPAPAPANRNPQGSEPVKPFNPTPTSKPAQSAPAPVPATKVAEAPKPAVPGGPPVVIIETSMGNIEVELTPEQTPATVANFLRYVDEKFYDGTVFHRVVRGFMIQGGGLDASFQEKQTHEPVVNESDKAIGNSRATIAMARKPDPNSATAQFYINLVDDNRAMLDHERGGYTAFGRVISGMDVVDNIAAVQVARTAVSEGQPLQTVEIRSIRRK